MRGRIRWPLCTLWRCDQPDSRGGSAEINPSTGQDAAEHFGLYALMLRQGQTLHLRFGHRQPYNADRGRVLSSKEDQIFCHRSKPTPVRCRVTRRAILRNRSEEIPASFHSGRGAIDRKAWSFRNAGRRRETRYNGRAQGRGWQIDLPPFCT